jgi:hypothetical protein
MQELLDDAVEALRRGQLYDEADRAYARLQADPGAWAEEVRERQAWDAAPLDGLGDAVGIPERSDG